MSLRQAINRKCRDCIADEGAAGSAAVQVELCACFECPLWPVRPVRQARIPFSAPVCDEQGLSPALAAFRLAHPFSVPSEALCNAETARWATGEGDGGHSAGEKAA